MSRNGSKGRDFVDRMLEEIHAEAPGRDTRLLAAVSRIQRATFFFQVALARVAARASLNVRELLLIAALRRAGPSFCLNPAQLLKECFAPSATMTRQIDHLETLGLVERKPDPSDRRSVLVRLTPRGRKLIDSTLTMGILPDEPEMQIARKLTSGEINALNRILHKLLVQLEAEESVRSTRTMPAGAQNFAGK